MATLKEIEELGIEKMRALKEARAKVETAQGEKRDLSAEEKSFVDKAMDDYDKWESAKQDAEKQDRLDKILAASEKTETKTERPNGLSSPEEETKTGESYNEAFNKWARGEGPENISVPDHLSQGERKALLSKASNQNEGTSTVGGVLVALQFANTIIEKLIDLTPMLGLVNRQPISGYQLQVPQQNAVGAAAWTAEEGAFNADQSTLTSTTITAYKATRIIQVSEELLADAYLDVEGYLSRRFADSFATLFNTALTVGTGSSQPFGIVPQIAAGQTTTYATGNTTSVPVDSIFTVFHSVLTPYRNQQAVWMARDATWRQVRTVKETTGQYIWQPGLQAGQPDLLLGHRAISNPDVAAQAANAKSLFFGRVDGHWAVEPAGGVTFQRLNELYAATGQVGFRAYMRLGSDFVGPSNSVALGKNSAT